MSSPSSAPTASLTPLTSAPALRPSDPDRADSAPKSAPPRRVALLGNPNTGKTTIFNRLSGLRHKTSNFPGTTQEARVGFVNLRDARRRRPASGDCCGHPADHEAPDPDEEGVELVDLPGVYSLELDQIEAQICRSVLSGDLALRGQSAAPPDAVCVVVDATNLSRGLVFVGEALRRRLPTVVALNMIDTARRRGLSISRETLQRELGCRVVLCSARTGEAMDELKAALLDAGVATTTPPGDDAGAGLWADRITALAASASPDSGLAAETLTDRLDHAFTHPVLGVALFALIMTALFWTLFSLATYPMDWIEAIFTALGTLIRSVMPAGILRDLIAGGVVSGISGVVVFLPQICLLFFLISLLEDTGYLARAAFVMDRVLRPFGLPGHAFVPLLSSHACALPGIMSARAIPDRRERLATILVAPFMTCSARLPVYILMTSLLFPDSPAKASLAFVGAYALGALAGVISALIARRTILRGRSRPMALELPTYRIPSLTNALVTMRDRATIFLKQAGTVILALSVVLWWLGAYPKVAPPVEAVALRAQAESTTPEESAALRSQAGRLESRHASAHSFMGGIGRLAEPLFAPIGYDWRLTIGVMASFAAREVFVSTMAIVLAGEEDARNQGVLQRMRAATRSDGRTPVFAPATSWSILVFYVLAMQCLPTLVVTAREAGGARWAVLQMAWMTGVAYAAALFAYHLALTLGAA